jgi:hypothetical protein
VKSWDVHVAARERDSSSGMCVHHRIRLGPDIEPPMRPMC